jgi:hypothetical protein
VEEVPPPRRLPRRRPAPTTALLPSTTKQGREKGAPSLTGLRPSARTGMARRGEGRAEGQARRHLGLLRRLSHGGRPWPGREAPMGDRRRCRSRERRLLPAPPSKRGGHPAPPRRHPTPEAEGRVQLLLLSSNRLRKERSFFSALPATLVGRGACAALMARRGRQLRRQRWRRLRLHRSRSEMRE